MQNQEALTAIQNSICYQLGLTKQEAADLFSNSKFKEFADSKEFSQYAEELNKSWLAKDYKIILAVINNAFNIAVDIIPDDVMFRRMEQRFNNSVKSSGGDKAKAEAHFNDSKVTDKQLIAKQKQLFDGMWKFYDGKETTHESNKGKDIKQDPTTWEKVKAFVLAIVTLGLYDSVKNQKDTFKDSSHDLKKPILGKKTASAVKRAGNGEPKLPTK